MRNHIASHKRKQYDVIRPKSHEEWLSERRNGIGASEAGAILNLSPYATPYKLWRLKVGIDDPVAENFAMKRGHYYEIMVADDFEKLGYQIIRNSEGDWIAVDPQKPWRRVSPDRIAFDLSKGKSEKNKVLLECKSTREEYTPEDLGGRLLHYFCQVQYNQHILGYKKAFLGMVHVDGKFEWFQEISYNERYCTETLMPAIDDFWLNHVKPCLDYANKIYKKGNGKYTIEQITKHQRYIEYCHQFAPAFTTSDDIVARYPKEEEGKNVRIDMQSFYEGLAEYKQIKREIKELESKAKAFEESVKTIMADAESLSDMDGNKLISWKANKASMKFDEKKFAEENKALYKKYLYSKEGARILKIK